MLKFKQNSLHACWSYPFLNVILPETNSKQVCPFSKGWLDEEITLKGVQPILRGFHSLLGFGRISLRKLRKIRILFDGCVNSLV